MMVLNKDGSWRMWIDYHALNNITIKNIYHFPRTDDFLDQLQQDKLFNKIYLKSGYHQVRIKEEDVWNTSFKTRQCLYECLVIPFVLCNAPVMFMRLMNDALRPFIDSFVILFMDDILIFINTWKDNLSHVM